MQAINGYLDNGRFIPDKRVALPISSAAILIINEVAQTQRRDDDKVWLIEFHRLAAASTHEVLRDGYFERSSLGRELLIFEDGE
jgi:hypothetical protein